MFRLEPTKSWEETRELRDYILKIESVLGAVQSFIWGISGHYFDLVYSNRTVCVRKAI